MGAQQSLFMLQRYVQRVLRTITVSTSDEGIPTYSTEPDDLIVVRYRAPDEAEGKTYPTDWLLQPAGGLPDGLYQISLLDKPEAEGGIVIGQHECNHRSRGENERGRGVEEQRATAMAIENIRLSTQDLRDTVERQRNEIARHIDEIERLRARLTELEGAGGQRLDPMQGLELIRSILTQFGDEKPAEAAKPAGPAALPGDASCPPG